MLGPVATEDPRALAKNLDFLPKVCAKKAAKKTRPKTTTKKRVAKRKPKTGAKTGAKKARWPMLDAPDQCGSQAPVDATDAPAAAAKHEFE